MVETFAAFLFVQVNHRNLIEAFELRPYLYIALKSFVLLMCTSLRFEPLSGYESANGQDNIHKKLCLRGRAVNYRDVSSHLTTLAERILFLLLLEKFRRR